MAYGIPRIIQGNNWLNWLSDSSGNDKIYAGGGWDRITVSYGFDQIWGGDGQDTLRLKGHFYDYRVFNLSDGGMALYSKEYGLKIAYDVECVKFYHQDKTGLFEVTDNYKVEANRLDEQALFSNNDLYYLPKTEGGAGSDILTGTALFGMGGNDVLTGHATLDSLLYGGDGNDRLVSGGGGDGLYGGAGNDTLIATGGNDTLNGGDGSDSFIFNAGIRGNVVIEDFNQIAGQPDQLVFHGQFADMADFRSHLTLVGSDVLVDAWGLKLTIHDITISQLMSSDVVIA